jgi:hypothetical protein
MLLYLLRRLCQADGPCDGIVWYTACVLPPFFSPTVSFPLHIVIHGKILRPLLSIKDAVAG